MLEKIIENRWQAFAIIFLVSLGIPFLIVTYTLIFSDQESVVFLEGFNAFVAILIILYYVLIIAIGAVWLVKRILKIITLRNETVKSEIRHLQSQVNPHFFFNMLNNLYGLVDKDAEKAKQLILKLSDMMRYSIYDGQKNQVSLAEEVGHIQNYISLHQMRYHKKSDITFEIDIEDEELKVMPLMFIILVENAIKHGMEHLRSDAFIHIQLQASKNSLTFEVMNNFDAEQVNDSKGMGLTNLKRRLNLMYPKRHELTCIIENTTYKASLKLHQL